MQLDAPAPERPTDPAALIAVLDAEREQDRAEIDELWNAACGSGDFDEYEAATDGYAARETQRYTALSNAVSAAPAVQPIVAADAARDREVLDSIATAMAESDDWDSDLTGMIADQVRSSGRPDPGFDQLTEDEEAAIDQAGGDLTEARARAYRDRIEAGRNAALAARFDSSPLGVEGLDDEINAAFVQMWQTGERAQILNARLMARQVLTAEPHAAYLDLTPDDDSRGKMNGVRLRNAAGDVIVDNTLDWEMEAPGRPEIDYLTSRLDDEATGWMQYTVGAPDDDGYGHLTYRLDLRAASNAIA